MNFKFSEVLHAISEYNSMQLIFLFDRTDELLLYTGVPHDYTWHGNVKTFHTKRGTKRKRNTKIRGRILEFLRLCIFMAG